MRNPFEYEIGCTGGPEPELEFSTGFPYCSAPIFTKPTFIYQQYIEPPDIDPPPFCPCIPTVLKSPHTGKATFVVGTGEKKFDFKMVPSTTDCCNPEFEFEYDIDIPCLPFSMTATNIRNESLIRPKLKVHKQTGTCKYQFTLESPNFLKKIVFSLYQHGKGVTFVTCCSGIGIIDMDMQVTRTIGGTLYVDVIHQVNVQIPLLALLAEETGELDRSTLYDPWDYQVIWQDHANGTGKGILKYEVTDGHGGQHD